MALKITSIKVEEKDWIEARAYAILKNKTMGDWIMNHLLEEMKANKWEFGKFTNIVPTKKTKKNEKK